MHVDVTLSPSMCVSNVNYMCAHISVCICMHMYIFMCVSMFSLASTILS